MKRFIQGNLPIINQFVAKIKVTNEISDNPNELAALVNQLTKELNLQIVKSFYHSFSPSGITYIAILAQSHLVVHTWPEYKTFHVDLVSCSDIDKIEVKKTLTKVFNRYIPTVTLLRQLD